MLGKLIDIENTFQRMRWLIIGSFFLSAAIAAGAFYFSYAIITSAREKIYVLDNGKSLLLALSHDMAQNRPVEARAHVKQFHQLFFTLSPDAKAIESNIKQALDLCDQSASIQHQNLLESGYYNRIISGNVSQEIIVDSMKVNYSQKPWQVRCYSTLTVVRTSVLQIKNLITSCYLREVQRSDNNPHGFLMERWEVIENKDLQTIER